MTKRDEEVSTGIQGLDGILNGLIPGDNVVFQVDSIEDYIPFVTSYYEYAQREEKRFIYFRFAKHRPLIPDNGFAEIHRVNPESGFETFISQIHDVIEQAGYGAFYVFDLLSDLVVDWYSDRMLGNFFMLTCPYLYDMITIAYFALLKDHHSFHAVKPIMQTTQVFMNIYRHEGRLYVHPLKVDKRYSPTMHMLHVWDNGGFMPITQSVINSEILTSSRWSKVESLSELLDPWTVTFNRAEEINRESVSESVDTSDERDTLSRLLRMAVTRNDRVFNLAKKYFTLGDILEVKRRMVGTGLIGGKAVGFLLARKILTTENPRWKNILESHDSFYIGSDVYYTFLVENGCWWIRQKQKNPESFLEDIEEARQRMLTGRFPDYILRHFEDILDYFGQSPFIVRSSSLQEDNFGNSFSGKYESVFCPNQGPREQRIEDFVSAVRTVYASTMSAEALIYREQRGILDRDEQMALLVQRVSGDQYGMYFFPQIAGVGLSFNPYVWSEYIDPEAGMLRLVFGLGTRAVDRADDDYTRVIALNDPKRRPESNFREVRRYAQRRVDLIDLKSNLLTSENFIDMALSAEKLPLGIFASHDEEEMRMSPEYKKPLPHVLTFDGLLSQTPFIEDMRSMLETIQKAYDYPVDIEFTANFLNEKNYKVNLLQCRPLQVKEGGIIKDPPSNLDDDNITLEARGAVIGFSRVIDIDRIIYVVPGTYGELPDKERYQVAQVIGRICASDKEQTFKNIMLIGPGRWGTGTPSLGIPVSFSQINTVSVLCEVVAMRDDLVPDVSLGTHFFNELVEADILYLALFPGQEGCKLNREFFESSPSRFPSILSSDHRWGKIIRVLDPAEFTGNRILRLNANTLKQRVVCYIAEMNG